MKEPLKNELNWSHSRAKAFRGCARAYWFNYYGSWDGWLSEAPPETRAAYVEKKLTARAMWIGTVVHTVAERVLKERQRRRRHEPDPEWWRDWACRTANDDIVGSASGAWRERPSKRVGFGEHYYGEPVTDEDWHAAVNDIDQLVVALFRNRMFRRLLEVPERIREIEEKRKFSVGGDSVFMALDVLVDDGQGGVVVLDWKTGAHHDDRDIAAQLGAYALYAAQELGVPEDRVTALHVNLRLGVDTRHAIGPEEIAAARATIARDMAEMRAPLRDVTANIADPNDFPTVPPGDPACRRCNFRRSCGREAARV